MYFMYTATAPGPCINCPSSPNIAHRTTPTYLVSPIHIVNFEFIYKIYKLSYCKFCIYWVDVYTKFTSCHIVNFVFTAWVGVNTKLQSCHIVSFVFTGWV